MDSLSAERGTPGIGSGEQRRSATSAPFGIVASATGVDSTMPFTRRRRSHMTRNGYLAGALCAIAILLGSSAQARDKDCGQPFKGHSSGTMVTSGAPPIIHIIFSGPAHLSGLGLSQIAFPHDWNVFDKSVTGFMTITAANGDELYAVVTGTAVPVVPGTLALNQTGTFTGGTGRFDDAEGSFSIIGTAVGNAVNVVMDGCLKRDRRCD
jgi:hypothetical protein